MQILKVFGHCLNFPGISFIFNTSHTAYIISPFPNQSSYMDQACKPRGRKYYTGPLLQESRESSLSFHVIAVNISCSGFPPGTVEVRETVTCRYSPRQESLGESFVGTLKLTGLVTVCRVFPGRLRLWRRFCFNGYAFFKRCLETMLWRSALWILCFSSSSDKPQDLAFSILQNHKTTGQHFEYGPHFELLLFLLLFYSRQGFSV